MRITLIHANATSIRSIEQAFRCLRPDVTLMILLDGSLATRDTTKEQLATLVTRDSMIDTAILSAP